MIHRLLPIFLLAGCAAQAEPVATVGPAQAGQLEQSAAREDARLLAFLDAAFDAQAALSPETLTSLGSRQDYDRLGDYTLEAGDEQLRLAERQLAQLATFWHGEHEERELGCPSIWRRGEHDLIQP